ncbi:MAG: hypothetical protein QM757_10180 [Paludibaculum sp.]
MQVFLGVKDKLKFISVRYNDIEWNGAGMKFSNPGHKTHIHIEWSNAGMSNTGFESDLRQAVGKISSSAADVEMEF